MQRECSPRIQNKTMKIKTLLLVILATLTLASEATATEADALEFYNKAMTEFRNGKAHMGQMYLLTVTMHRPGFKDCELQLANSYVQSNRLQDAVKMYIKHLSLKPNDDEARLQLAQCQKKLFKLGEAVSTLQEIPKSSAFFAQARNELFSINPKLVAEDESPAAEEETIEAKTKVPAKVTKNPNRPVTDKWALVIGISKFANPQYNLKYAAKDAKDFYNYLITDGNFKKDHVLLLLNENATRRNIMSAFGDKFLPAVSEDGDLVTIFISTHGTPAAKDPGQRNFIVAYDTESDALYETGVDMDELYRRVKKGVRTDRALVIMDTCYSGAGIPGSRGLDESGNFDLSQLAQGSGHMFLTSSSPAQRSWESRVSENGVFTKYLIQNLKLTKGNVSNAFEKLQHDVSWEVKNAYNQQQQPQTGGTWEGKELILNAIPVSPRPILNPDIVKMINLQNIPTK